MCTLVCCDVRFVCFLQSVGSRLTSNIIFYCRVQQQLQATVHTSYPLGLGVDSGSCRTILREGKRRYLANITSS